MDRKNVAALAAALLSVSAAWGNNEFWSHSISPRTIAQSMSNQELAGQVLMLGYVGVYPSDEFLAFARESTIGGVKIFGRNSGDLAELAAGIGAMQIDAMAGRLGAPLLVATDQEGGWVRHVKGATSETPGNLAIGASGLALDAYQSGLVIGKELSLLGINMNFAPTVDVYTDPRADVIGPRAFSSDPVETAFLALAFFRGLERAGVAATAKHFPGHGNTSRDSHGTLPVIPDSYETIWDRDLVPYRMLIAEGLPAIMSGHLSYPAITGRSVAATLSPHLLRSVLRNDLKFEGVIITDDMRMYGALQNGVEVPEACELALRAGNDMVLVSQDIDLQREVYDHLVATADDDPAFRRILVEATVKILTLKQRYLAGKPREEIVPSPEDVYANLPYREGRAPLFDLACRSVTVVRPDAVPLPAAPAETVLLVGQYDAFFEAGRARLPGAAVFRFSFSGATERQILALRSLASEYDRIILCLANYESLDVLKRLEDMAAKITVLSVLTPVYLRETPWVRSAVATFARGADSFEAGFSVLLGDYTAEGSMPIFFELPEL